MWELRENVPVCNRYWNLRALLESGCYSLVVNEKLKSLPLVCLLYAGRLKTKNVHFLLLNPREEAKG